MHGRGGTIAGPIAPQRTPLPVYRNARRRRPVPDSQSNQLRATVTLQQTLQQHLQQPVKIHACCFKLQLKPIPGKHGHSDRAGTQPQPLPVLQRGGQWPAGRGAVGVHHGSL